MSDQFFVTGGSMPANSPSYIERAADTDLLDALVAGQFCYVLTSRQMGKSSLTSRARLRLRDKGIASCYIDLTKVGTNVTVSQWYSHLLEIVGRGLDLEDEVEDFLDANKDKGGHYVWSNALSELIVPHLTKPLVIFVDEIDLVRSLPFSASEFFAGIRELHNQRATNPALSKLTFCLLGVATPSDLIPERHITPFNIGTRVELRDFDKDEVQQLKAGWAVERAEEAGALVERAWYWTCGQPYLTQRLCYEAAHRPQVHTVEELDAVCSELFLSKTARERDPNLAHVRDRLLGDVKGMRARLELYRQVWRGRKVPANDLNPVVGELLLAGAVAVSNGFLKVKNPIYAAVFDERWVRSHVSRDWALILRKARAAAALAFAILCVPTAIYFWREARSQTRERELAEHERQKAEEARQRSRLAEDAAKTEALRLMRESTLAEKARKEAVNRELEAEKARLDAVAAARRSDEEAAASRKVINDLIRQPLERALQDRNAYIASYVLSNAPASVRGELQAAPPALLHPAGVVVLSHRARGIQFTADSRSLLVTADSPSSSASDTLTNDRLSVVNFLAAPPAAMLPPLQQEGPIAAIAFSPDGKRLAVVSADDDKGEASVWDVRQRKQEFVLLGQGMFKAVAWSPDGRFIACGGDGKEEGRAFIDVWRVEPGAVPFREATLASTGATLTALAFSPDSRMLAVCGGGNGIALWNTRDWKARPQQMQHGKKVQDVRDVSFPAEGNLLVAGGEEWLEVWNRETGKRGTAMLAQGKERTQSRTVSAVAVTPNGKWAAAGLSDGAVMVVDFDLGLRFFMNSPSPVTAVAFLQDSSRLVSAHEDGMIRIWDTVEGKTLRTLPACAGRVTCVRYDPLSGWIAAGGARGEVRFWDARFNEQSTPLAHSVESVRQWLGLSGKELPLHVAVHPTEASLAACLMPDGTVCLMNVRDHAEVARSRVTGKIERSEAVAHWLPPVFSPDGRLLGIANSTGMVWMHEIKAAPLAMRLVADGVQMAPSADSLTMTPQHCLLRRGDRLVVRSCAELEFASNGGRLARDELLPDETLEWTQFIHEPLIASRDHLLWMGSRPSFLYHVDRWDVTQTPSRYGYQWSSLGKSQTSDQRRFLSDTSNERAVTACAFHPDGVHIALAHQDRTLSLWSYDQATKTMRLLASDSSQPEPATCLAFRPDGLMLASCADDVVRLFAVKTLLTATPLKEDREWLNRRSGLQAQALDVVPAATERLLQLRLEQPWRSDASTAWWQAIRASLPARLKLSAEPCPLDVNYLRAAWQPLVKVLQDYPGSAAELLAQSFDAHPWLALVPECSCPKEWLTNPTWLDRAPDIPINERILLLERALKAAPDGKTPAATTVEMLAMQASAYDLRSQAIAKVKGDTTTERTSAHDLAVQALESMAKLPDEVLKDVWQRVGQDFNALDEDMKDEAFIEAYVVVAPVESVIEMATQGLSAANEDKAKLTRVLATLQKIIARAPGNFEVLNWAGVTAYKLGDYELSVDYGLQAAAVPETLEKNRALAWTNVGEAWLRRKDLAVNQSRTEALSAFEKAIKADPTYVSAYSHRAGAWGRDKAGRQHAVEDLQEAVRLEPSDPDLICELASALFDMERRDSAFSALDDLVARAATAENLWYKRAETIANYAQSDADYDLALTAIDKALQIVRKRDDFMPASPSYLTLQKWKAKYLYDAWRQDEAMPILESILAVSPKHVDALTMRAAALRLTGEFEQSLADFNASLEQEPNSAYALCRRGSLYVSMGKLDLAQKDFERGLELGFQTSSHFLTRFYLMQGTPADLDALDEKLVKPLLKAEPEWPANLASQVRLLDARREHAKAADIAKRAVASLPNYPTLPKATQAELLAMAGEFDQALILAHQSRAGLPNSPLTNGLVAGVHCWRARGGVAGPALAADAFQREIDLAALAIARGLEHSDVSVEWMLTEPNLSKELRQHPLFVQAVDALRQTVAKQDRWLRFAEFFAAAADLVQKNGGADATAMAASFRDQVFVRLAKARDLGTVDAIKLSQQPAFVSMAGDARWKSPWRWGASP